MKGIIKAIGRKWNRNLEHIPDKAEILHKEKHQTINFIAIMLWLSVITIMAGYVLAQPVSFEGDIEITVNNGGDFAETIDNTLCDKTGSTLTSNAYNFTSGIETIHLHGEFSAPAYTVNQYLTLIIKG